MGSDIEVLADVIATLDRFTSSEAPGPGHSSVAGMAAVVSGGLPGGPVCGGNRVAWCLASRANVQDVPVVAVLVGLQASGKTTFCRDVLGERYVQVSKDHFPNARNRQQRQLRLVRAALAAGRDVAIAISLEQS